MKFIGKSIKILVVACVLSTGFVAQALAARLLDRHKDCFAYLYCIHVDEYDDYVEAYIESETDYKFRLQFIPEIRGTVRVMEGSLQPQLVDVPSYGQRKYLLKFSKPSGGYNFEWHSNILYGNGNNEHDNDHVYILPFREGERYELAQGYNGPFTHRGNQKYALDFAMEEGRDIVAARDGIIVDIEYDSNMAILNFELAEANYVSVMHEDGTIAQYVHLKPGGVRLNVGDKVRAGDIIGWSGNTGFSTGPHLHFHVGYFDKRGVFKTVPVRFWLRESDLKGRGEGLFSAFGSKNKEQEEVIIADVPKAGRSYTAVEEP